MQIPILARKGQAKPYGSIPRINWLHPLAAGLVTYMYDAGGGVVFDLVSGKRCTISTSGTLTNTPTPTTSAFGSAWNTNGGQVGNGTNAWGVDGVGSPTLDGVTSAAPFSAVTGYTRRGNNATNYGTIFCFGDASTNTPFWIALDPSNLVISSFGSFAFAPGLNVFATTATIVTSSTSENEYHVDSVNGFNVQTTARTLASYTGLIPAFYNEGINGFDCSFNGSIFYGAVWKLRALTSAEIAQLHQDPYCFLIYPEDAIFSTLVGAAATPVSPERRSIVTVQEQPSLGAAFLGSGKQGPNVASGIGRIITVQELWLDGRSVVGAGKQGPNVASGIGRIFTVQEMPQDDLAVLVGSYNFTSLAATVSPNKRSVVTVQEQPSLGAAFLGAGKQGPNVASGIGRVLLIQEQPPSGVGVTFNAGRQGPNVASGIGRILTIQEYPPLGNAVSWVGKQGPDVASGIGRVLNVQEQPAPGVGTFFGAYTFVAASTTLRPERRAVITVQELPSDGRVLVGTGKQGPNVASGIGNIFTVQEQPREGLGTLLKSYNFTNAPTIFRTVFTIQELPPSGLTFLQAGRQGPNVASGIRSISTIQELPPLGIAILGAGLQGPDVASGIGRILTIQELPPSGLTFLRAGRQGPDVASGIRSISTIQELPPLGIAILGAGLQGPDVASGIGRILTIQELPPSGIAFLAPGKQGPNVASGIGRILNVQEYPSLGNAFFKPSYNFVLAPVPPGRRQTITIQELPPDGRSLLGAGVQGPNVTPSLGRTYVVWINF